ncbi:MAG: HU family DNA-binding protein [Hyphomicrobiales bacterium]
MSIKYKVIQRKNPSNPSSPVKYYGSIITSGRKDPRFISEEIADRSSLNIMDILATIEGFLQVIPKHLADGHIIDLGDFGSFRVTGRSEGVEEEKDFNSSNFKGLKVSFRPGRLFQKELDYCKFEKESQEAEPKLVDKITEE